MTRVVVVGGGYAGLATLGELRTLMPEVELHLVDPHESHLKRTRLHEAASRPLDELTVPFSHLAERLRFTHHRGTLGAGGHFTLADVVAWQADAAVPIAKTDGTTAPPHPFDYLVLTTGAAPVLRAPATPAPDDSPMPRAVAPLYSLAELQGTELRRLLRDLSGARGDDDFRVSVVGAGASGIQYAFELAEAVRRLGFPAAVRVLDVDRHVLPEMPSRVHRYVLERMRLAGIEWLPGCRFLRQAGDVLHYQVEGEDGERAAQSQLTLLLAGVSAHPQALTANRFGQLQVEGATLANVLTAGDCAQLDADGSNSATAQVAVRQGKHLAVNISRLQRRRDPLPWVFRELGYVVSLGAVDAVGWVFTPDKLVTGMGAVGIKTLVDAQYDLYLEGIDTYLV
jgi:NADH dehydrogenase